MRRYAVCPSLVVFAFTLAMPFCSMAWQQGEKASGQNALVNQYCAGCHNAKLMTGGLNLQAHSPDKIASDGEVWEKVLRKLNANEMPPAGLPRPPAADLKKFTSYLESQLDAAALLNPNPGRPTVHRLNRAEYSNAVRDLLNINFRAGDTLPVDDTGYGFDNIADVLSLSPVLVERYLSAARKVTHLALGTDKDLPPVVDSFDCLSIIRAAQRSTNRGQLFHNGRVSEDLPYDSAGGVSVQYTFPVDAEYVFRIKLSASNGPFGETDPPVGQVLELRTRVRTGVHHVGLALMRSDSLPEPTGGGRGRGGPRGAAEPQPIRVDLRLDGARLKLYDALSPAAVGKELNALEIGGPYNIT